MMQLGFIFSLLFAIIVTIFALQNSAAVNINFLFANVKISQALVIFISAVLGAVIFAILGFYRNLKFKLNLNKANKQIKTLESENTEFKNKVQELESSIAVLETSIAPVNKDNSDKNLEIEPTKELKAIKTVETKENMETK